MRKLYPTLVCCLLVTVFVSRRGAGPILLNVLPVVLGAWLILLAYRALKRKERPGLQLVKVGIWLGGVALAASAQAYMYVNARDDAVRVSTAAERFGIVHGTYPCSVRDIGFQETDDRVHRRLANLYCLDGEPHLWYFSSFRPYAMEEYSFRSHGWSSIDATPD